MTARGQGEAVDSSLAERIGHEADVLKLCVGQHERVERPDRVLQQRSQQLAVRHMSAIHTDCVDDFHGGSQLSTTRH
jgi:hypothetical protein